MTYLSQYRYADIGDECTYSECISAAALFEIDAYEFGKPDMPAGVNYETYIDQAAINAAYWYELASIALRYGKVMHHNRAMMWRVPYLPEARS